MSRHPYTHITLGMRRCRTSGTWTHPPPPPPLRTSSMLSPLRPQQQQQRPLTVLLLLLLMRSDDAYTPSSSRLSSHQRTTLPHPRVLSSFAAPSLHQRIHANPFLLTTTRAGNTDAANNDGSNSNRNNNPFRFRNMATRLSASIAVAVAKFQARPVTYLLIPCVAALVGWFTNWLAVQMIFYPVSFWGVPLYRQPEVPLGLLGWQGIIPCKTRPLTIALTDMVTSQLLTVPEALGRLDPRQVARLLAPELPKLTQEIVFDILPPFLTGLPQAVYNGFDSVTKGIVLHFNTKFIERLTVGLQQNAEAVFSLRNCVVNQMLLDRTKLGELFQTCCKAELDFLTNSGLWFGFLLGIVQMVVALFWDNPWSLSIGGGIVGLATNWLALKWIFEPVDPLKIGPWLLQGKFLKRQKEVAAVFSNYFASNILTGEQIWKSILTDPETQPAFARVFGEHFSSFVGRITRGFRIPLEPETMARITQRALDKLPNHVSVLFPYMDKALGLEQTLRIRMEQMTSRKFERVLHPIFEEDELTLIVAGAVLGFAAGLVQQGLETGAIKIPNVWTPIMAGTATVAARIRKRFTKNNKGENSSDGKDAAARDEDGVDDDDSETGPKAS